MVDTVVPVKSIKISSVLKSRVSSANFLGVESSLSRGACRIFLLHLFSRSYIAMAFSAFMAFKSGGRHSPSLHKVKERGRHPRKKSLFYVH